MTKLFFRIKSRIVIRNSCFASQVIVHLYSVAVCIFGVYMLSFCSDSSFFEDHLDSWHEPYFLRTWDTDKWIITADGSLLMLSLLSAITIIFMTTHEAAVVIISVVSVCLSVCQMITF